MDFKLSDLSSSSSLDARIVRTRAALRGTLLALLEQKPYDQITIREIAKQADIGYATFFRHYASKEELLHDLAADAIRDLIALVRPFLYATDSHAAAMTLCRHVAERRALWTGLLTGGAAGMMREELARQSRQTRMEYSQTLSPAQVQAQSWLPLELAVSYSVSTTVEILAWWLQQEEKYPLEQIATILDRLVITPTCMSLKPAS